MRLAMEGEQIFLAGCGKGLYDPARNPSVSFRPKQIERALLFQFCWRLPFPSIFYIEFSLGF
jgi:hypothetical protein